MGEHGSGFDVTSGGELYRALAAGGTGSKIVFAGVGKTDRELRYGLESNVTLFNVESEAELHALAGVAEAVGKAAPVALGSIRICRPRRTQKPTPASKV